MSGGKETPRQKMIGMMYLVLTALLALQVSSAIMEKFIFLDESLMYAVGAADKNNSITVQKIDKAVADGGGKDKAVSDKASEVRKATASMIKQMNDLRTEMIMTSGGYEDDGVSYKGAKEEEAIARLMVGTEGSKAGKAYALQGSLNKFGEQTLPGIVGKDMPKVKIAMDGKEDPKYSKKPDQKSKDFGAINFSETPLVAALAVMATFESEVKKLETQALDLLAAQVGAADLKFDQVFAVAVAKSSTIAAGTDYEADLFLAASSSATNPTMKRNGAPIPVQNGKGKVKFRAAASSYDNEGNSKQKWTGTITINSKGKDTSFTQQFDYVVAKPVIQIQSASVNALYLRCGNELSVQVPALGATYSPSFSATGAALKPMGKGAVVVIPNNPTGVKLNVSSGGSAIGSVDFKVRGIPKPTIQVLSNGRELDQKNGVPSPGPRSIQIKAKADESFSQFLPKDSRYAVTKWNVMLARGKRPVTQQNYSTEMASLSAMASQAQPGDRLIIEVQEVYRTNFLGEKEKVNIGTPIFTVPLQ